MRRSNILLWIILGFLFIGLLRVLILRPSTILIPLLVFGVIYYFLKHPEKLRKRGARQHHHYSKPRNTNRKEHPFKVIKGNKDDSDEPHYH